MKATVSRTLTNPEKEENETGSGLIGPDMSIIIKNMNISLKTNLAVLFVFTFVPIVVSAQESGIEVPAGVKPFVAKDKAVFAIESADLNGDGTKDYILVVENAKAADGEGVDDKRSLLILTSDSSGKLKLIKTNDKIVFCRSCGGVFGDPFAGVRVKLNSFKVDNYGGSNWRWSYSYTFNYSRIDKTSQLVRVVEDSFNALDPKKYKTKTSTPKKFGKVDIADLDPDKIHN